MPLCSLPVLHAFDGARATDLPQDTGWWHDGAPVTYLHRGGRYWLNAVERMCVLREYRVVNGAVLCEGCYHLAARVRMVAADWCDSTYAWKMAGGLRVACRDGTEHEARVAGQRGSVHQPLTADEIESKFGRLAAGRTDPDRVVEAVRRLEDAPDLGSLWASLDTDPQQERPGR